MIKSTLLLRPLNRHSTRRLSVLVQLKQPLIIGKNYLSYIDSHQRFCSALLSFQHSARTLATFSWPLSSSTNSLLLNKKRAGRSLSLSLLAETTTIVTVTKSLGTTSKQRQQQQQRQQHLQRMEWRKITCFGDSITRRSKDPDNGCWAGHIAQRVLNYYDVDVRGFEGYNTRWALELMPQLFPRAYLEKVDVFISFFGHNDSWDPPAPMHVPVEEYEENTRSIIEYLKDNGLDTSKIILITPAWYFEEDLLEFLRQINFPPAGKSKDEALRYAEAVKRVAQDYNITCVDFYGKTVDYEPLKSLFCDGVHFSRQGAKLLFDSLWPEVEKKIVDKHQKDLADIYHVTPCDQRPEVKPLIEALLKAKASK